jgi:hypothetical protein
VWWLKILILMLQDAYVKSRLAAYFAYPNAVCKLFCAVCVVGQSQDEAKRSAAVDVVLRYAFSASAGIAVRFERD